MGFLSKRIGLQQRLYALDESQWRQTLDGLLDDLRRATSYLDAEGMNNAAQEALDKARRRTQ
jgi:hypothetical protein